MATSAPLERSGTRGYAHLVELRVPIGRVWRALTEPALVGIWQNARAEVDPRPGGLYRTTTAAGVRRDAQIDVFMVNRRLRLIYLPDSALPPCSSAIVDDFLLDAKPEHVALRLLGSGIPEAREWDRHYARMRIGWERLLSRLKQTLENPPRPDAEARKARAEPPLPGLEF